MLQSAASDYYVTTTGNDSSDGLSPASAWRSISRVNRARFHAGDSIKFESGSRFEGNLHLDSSSMPTEASGLTITSGGSIPAVLSAGLGTGIQLLNLGGITLSNLVVEGAGSARNTGHGILCDNTSKTRRSLTNLTVVGVTAKGFGVLGLNITALRTGFEHVRIDHCAFTDNRRGGMEVASRLPYDDPSYAHKDVEVRDCQAYSNPGDPKPSRDHTGSGIVLYHVDGGLVTGCKAWDNGTLGDNRIAGGVGIWVYASRHVTIEHCESFSNHTRGRDGGGFDIDGGCESCVLQYNYSHDNDGPGFMLYSYPYALFGGRNNIVRFNLSENDSRKNRTYAGLWICTDGQPMTGVEIHENTVITGDWADQTVFIHARQVQGKIHHNTFVGRGRAIPIRIRDAHPGMQIFDNKEWQNDSAP